MNADRLAAVGAVVALAGGLVFLASLWRLCGGAWCGVAAGPLLVGVGWRLSRGAPPDAQ